MSFVCLFLLFPLSDLGANFEAKEQASLPVPGAWTLTYILLPTKRYYSNVKLLQYFSTGGKKIFSAAGADKRSWVDMPEGELLSILPAHMGTIFCKDGEEVFFMCAWVKNASRRGDVFGCHSLGEGEKEIVKNGIKMRQAFYNFDLTFWFGKLHNFSIAKK